MNHVKNERMRNLVSLISIFGFMRIVSNQVNVTRLNSDIFSFGTCNINCNDYAGYCYGNGKCCSCKCYYGKTYYKDTLGPKCVMSPGHAENCAYHFLHHDSLGQSLLLAKLIVGGTVTQIGQMIVSSKKKTTCEFVENECMFWNVHSWMPLFTEGREGKDFYILKSKKPNIKNIQFNSHQKNITLYQGLLVKMQVKCKGIKQSCLMFKYDGSHYYGDKIVASTKPVTVITNILNSTPISKKGENKSTDVGIIVGVTILMLCIILFIIGLVFWVRRRRKHSERGINFVRDKNQQSQMKLLKKHKKCKGEEAIYQTPDFRTDFANDDDPDFDNPGYLVPVDSTKKNPDEVVYHDPDIMFKKKKDPNYDYPELHIQKREKKDENSIKSTHIYADVATDCIEKKQSENKNSNPTGYMKLDTSVADAGYQELNTTTNSPPTPLQTITKPTDSLPNIPETLTIDSPPHTPGSVKYFDLEKDTLNLEDMKRNVSLPLDANTEPNSPLISPVTPVSEKYFELEDDQNDECEI